MHGNPVDIRVIGLVVVSFHSLLANSKICMGSEGKLVGAIR
jgi:hypothetical protein